MFGPDATSYSAVITACEMMNDGPDALAPGATPAPSEDVLGSASVLELVTPAAGATAGAVGTSRREQKAEAREKTEAKRKELEAAKLLAAQKQERDAQVAAARVAAAEPAGAAASGASP